MNTSKSKPTSEDTGSESNNTMQCGFDFGETEDGVSVFSLQPLGTWDKRSPSLKIAQHEVRLAAAEERVLSVVGPSRGLFANCLQAEREAFALQLKCQCATEETEFSLWGARHTQPSFSDDDLQAFFNHCVTHEGANYNGIIYKVRRELTMLTASMHVPGLGSLTVRNWSRAGLGLDFHLIDRDTFFLESFRDGRREIELPYSVWGSCCGAQKLSDAKGIASLPTFTVAGREYVQLGGMYSQSRREGEAWLVGALSDWRGPTFESYQIHIAAYNAGTVERGDNRGLLVKVRGVVCVLVSPALVYDDNVGVKAIAVDEPQEDAEEEFEESEEEVTA